MSMLRLDRPSILVYGGTIAAGCHNGKKLDIVAQADPLGRLYGVKLGKTVVGRRNCWINPKNKQSNEPGHSKQNAIDSIAIGLRHSPPHNRLRLARHKEPLPIKWVCIIHSAPA